MNFQTFISIILLGLAQCFQCAIIIQSMSNNVIRSNEDGRKCMPDEIYVSAEENCLKKVSLDFECEYNEQCESETAQSYCGYETNGLDIQREYRVCLCKDGHRWVSTSTGEIECIPIQQCTRPTGFNAHELQGNCPKNQFCRNGLCLCKANFHYDEMDKACVFRHSTCPTGRVLIPKVGCFRQALPGRKCKFTQQCNSLTENSFCKKIGNNDGVGFCQCSHGFVPTQGWGKCESMESVVGQIVQKQIDEYEKNELTENITQKDELFPNITTHVEHIAKANNRALQKLNLMDIAMILIIALMITNYLNF